MPYSAYKKQLDQKGKVLTLGANPLDVLRDEHKAQAKLCDILESIADDLPDMVNPHLCRYVIASLQHDIPLHHIDEEKGLFPLLEKRADPNINISKYFHA